MTELDEEEHALLAAARRGLSPSAGDQARVRLATFAAINAAALGTASVGHAHPSSGPMATGLSSAKTGAWATKVVAASAIAVASGGGGYFLGFHEAKQEAAEARAGVLSSTVPVVATVANPVTAPPMGEEGLSKEFGKEPERTLHSAAPRPSASATLETTLEQEVRAMRRIERSLRDQNPLYALALLNDLDHTVPNGHLAEERAAARVIAGCQMGNENAAPQAGAFATRYPQSVYSDRVAQACLGTDDRGERIVAPPETHAFKQERTP